jgi:hypothetical protein
MLFLRPVTHVPFLSSRVPDLQPDVLSVDVYDPLVKVYPDRVHVRRGEGLGHETLCDRRLANASVA